MKIIFLFFVISILLFSCKDNSQKIHELQIRIDSLEFKIENTYQPGFGEMMSNVQIHHAKLWFAGIDKNWSLADFEIHEIEETLDDIKKYQTDRVESKSIDLIAPALENMKSAINKKDLSLFKVNFQILTNTCNECHRAVNFGFNKVKIPDAPPFTNQKY